MTALDVPSVPEDKMSRCLLLVLGLVALFFSESAAVDVIATQNDSPSDGVCQCHSNVTVNIPPCVCSGLAETLEENRKLTEEIRRMVEPDCSPQNPTPAAHIRVEGVRWTRFWWYNPSNGWPSSESDVLGVPYEACQYNASYCFGRLPGGLRESDAELLAVDSAGTVYRWKFDPSNPTAHAAWNAFYHHRDQRITHSRAWDPHVIAGPTPNVQQDSFTYRLQNGVRSLLLDDDGCDCYSTLSFGHGLCGSSFSTTYGPAGRFGVDLLYDTYCQTPDPKRGLTLYFRDDDDCDKAACPYGRYCVDRVNSYLCV